MDQDLVRWLAPPNGHEQRTQHEVRWLAARYRFVWSTKYRYKVLRGDITLRVRDICRQVCTQNGVVLSFNHVHMFVSVPPKLAIMT